jgi:cytochrome c oxidase subunit 2
VPEQPDVRLLADGAFNPEGPAAETIADLGWLMLALGGAVFLLFVVLLALALFRRRRPEADVPDDAGTERRWLLGGGVVMPLAVLAVVFVGTIAAMRSVRNTAPDNALVVEVVGHQWWWEVRYPDAGVTTANELRIPVGRPVAVRLTSADVIHSFWVPALAGKMDLLPDGTNTLVLEADEPGEHFSQCAEFCGLQHTKMALTVVAEPAERFGSWLGERRAAAAEPSSEVGRRGRQVFLAAGCPSCHTVRGTSAQGAKGPDLTHVASRPTLGAGAVTNTRANLSQWVRNPHDMKPGVNMPAPELSADELDALVAYLVSLE